MSQNDEFAALAGEFEDLVNRIVDCSRSDQETAVRDWIRNVPERLLRFAITLVNIYKSRGQIFVNTGITVKGDLEMTDKSTHVNTGGGDITGGAIGAGAQLTAQIIQSIKGNIGSSGNIDAEGQKLFVSAADEIGAQQWSADEKNEALGDLEKLGKEAAKPEAKPSLIKRSWAAVSAIAGQLPSIISLGKWLAGKFPGVFGT